MSSTPARLGRYELLGQLATGGMAEIHLARLTGDGGFEKTLVIKRLLPNAKDSAATAVFFDEARLVAQMNHPNICEVYELARDHDEYFLVLPYLDGVPVTDFIARAPEPERMAELRVAAGIIVQACAGLHHAHELRTADGKWLEVVHRDVSPSNLFVTTAGMVKVLDFGIAKVVREGAAQPKTELGMIKGKLQYMSPEQVLGQELDRRSDIYALGIVLYELATHQRLFARPSEFETAKAIVEGTVPRADAADPEIPKPFADVIARALARNRDDRYATARDFAKAIEGAIDVATPNEISDALGSWHGNELSALRTRQKRLIEVARSVQTLAPRIASGSQVATSPFAPPTVASGSQVATAPFAQPSQAVASAAFAQSQLLTPPPPQPHLVNAPQPRSSVSRLLPALLAGLAGLGLILFFATRKSPFALAPHRDALVADIDAPPPIDAARDAPTDPNDIDAAGSATHDGAASHDGATHETDVRPTAKPGFVSIDSTPFATISVDGKPFGVTPLVKKSIAAGRHHLRAVTKDGRSKELDIRVPAGKLAPPVRLTW